MSPKNNMLFLTLLAFSLCFLAAVSGQKSHDYRRTENNQEASDELSFDTLLGSSQSPGCSNRRQFYGYDYNFYNEGFDNTNTATAGPLQWRPVLPIRTNQLPVNPYMQVTKAAESQNDSVKVRYLDPALIPKTTKSPEEIARLYPSYTILNSSSSPTPPNNLQSFSPTPTPLLTSVNIPNNHSAVFSPINLVPETSPSPLAPPLNHPQLTRPEEDINLYKFLMPSTDFKPPITASVSENQQTPNIGPINLDDNTKSLLGFLGGNKMANLESTEQKDDSVFDSIFQTKDPIIQQDLSIDKCVVELVKVNNSGININTNNTFLDEVELTRRFDINGTVVLDSVKNKKDVADDQDNMRSGERIKSGNEDAAVKAAQVARLSKTMGAINSARVCFACSSLSDPTCWKPTRTTTVKYCRNGNFCVTRRYYAEDEGEAPIVIRDCSRSCDVTLANNILEDRYEACSICAEDLCNDAVVDNTPSKAHTFNTFNLLPYLCVVGFYKYSF